MPDTRKNRTPGPKHGGGTFQNRQCATCTPPCQGGEVLHKRGHCCHSYCLCTGFTPEGTSLMGALDQALPQMQTKKNRGYVREV